MFVALTVVFFVLACAAVIGTGVMLFVPMRARPKPPEPTGPVDAAPSNYFTAPFFQLKDRSGEEVTKADLQGKVWVAAFIFTRCKMGCEEVTATMTRLQTELNLADADDLRLVTFTVDPERDTLDDLRKYAEKVRSHPTKWLYLTGPEKLVRQLLQQGFHITANRKKNPQEGDEYEHSTKLFVVDQRGDVRGTFDGKQGEHDRDGEHYRSSLERLKRLVGELRADQPAK